MPEDDECKVKLTDDQRELLKRKAEEMHNARLAREEVATRDRDLVQRAGEHKSGAKPGDALPESGSRGKKNIYTCEQCGGHIVTIDRDEGTTPFMITCASGPVTGCRGRMRSSFYRVDQSLRPTHEWWKPTVLEEPIYSSGMQEHLRKGGLALRLIPPAGGGVTTRTTILGENMIKFAVALCNGMLEAAKDDAVKVQGAELEIVRDRMAMLLHLRNAFEQSM